VVLHAAVFPSPGTGGKISIAGPAPRASSSQHGKHVEPRSLETRVSTARIARGTNIAQRRFVTSHGLQSVAQYLSAVASMEGPDEAGLLLPVAECLVREVVEDDVMPTIQRFITHSAIQPRHGMAVALMAIYLLITCKLKSTMGDGSLDSEELRTKADALAARYTPALTKLLHSHVKEVSLSLRLSALQLTAAIQDVHWEQRAALLRHASIARCVVLPFWVATATSSLSAWHFFQEVGSREQLQPLLARSAHYEMFLQWSEHNLAGYSVDPDLKSMLKTEADCVASLMAKVTAGLSGDSFVDFSFSSCPLLSFRLVAGDSSLYLIQSEVGVVYSPRKDGGAPRGVSSQQRTVARISGNLALTEDKLTPNVQQFAVQQFEWASTQELQGMICSKGYARPAVGEFMAWLPHDYDALNSLLGALDRELVADTLEPAVDAGKADVASPKCGMSYVVPGSTSVTGQGKPKGDTVPDDNKSKPATSGRKRARSQYQSANTAAPLSIRPVPVINRVVTLQVLRDWVEFNLIDFGPSDSASASRRATVIDVEHPTILMLTGTNYPSKSGCQFFCVEPSTQLKRVVLLPGLRFGSPAGVQPVGTYSRQRMVT
jgi:hypothetical protein